MKKLLLIPFALFALASCSDDKETPPVPEPQVVTISFEAGEQMTDSFGTPIVLGDALVEGFMSFTTPNVYWLKPLAYSLDEKDAKGQIAYSGNYIRTADGLAGFGGFYNDGTSWGSGVSDTWGGFSLSANYNMTATASEFSNGFFVWANTGADNTATFAVAYDSNGAGAAYDTPIEPYGTPEITFYNNVTIRQISLANSTYTYPFFTGKAGDKFVVAVTGYLNGSEVGVVECPLVNGADKVSGWKTFDLSSLGMVDAIRLEVISSDDNAPYYFCLDQIVVVVPTE